MITGRIAIFGGSFDPPHLAHAMVALAALLGGQVDRVLVVPVGRHAWGKPTVAPFEDRLAMCRLAFRPLGQGVVVSDIEGRREGTSFMIDTLRGLAAENPDAQWRLLTGSDIEGDVAKWREGAEVIRMAPPLTSPRPVPGLPLEDQPGVMPPISSTEVRRYLAEGRPASHLVAAEVLAYAQVRKLYTR